MEYRDFKPHNSLQPYIHSFWELKGGNNDGRWERIFPDGCPGLVVNLGDACITDGGEVTMEFGKTYVVGAMTSFKDNYIDVNTHLFGVCLKPATFSNFYNYAPQYELTNKTIEFEKSHAFSIDKFSRNPVRYLNNFFSERLTNKNGLLQSVIQDIHKAGGQLEINEIAKRNFITVRQLERQFNMHIGITPKEYSGIVRFQNALSLIKTPNQQRSLLDIAINCGYYDHSHLTSQIKKNTGLLPSQF